MLNPVWVAIFYKETISQIALVGAVIVVGAIVCYNLKKAINQQKQPPAAASEPLPAGKHGPGQQDRQGGTDMSKQMWKGSTLMAPGAGHAWSPAATSSSPIS